MIKSLTLTNTAHPADVYHWAPQVPALQAGVEFSEGLNILFGPNGSGKSTIAGLCAFLTASEQGGASTLTEDWVRKLFDFMFERDPVARLEYDGTPTLYVNPRNRVGLVGGGGAFDDDFFSLGVGSIMAKGSTGQLSLHRIDHIAHILMGVKPKAPKGKKHAGGPEFSPVKEFPSEIVRRINRDRVNNTWKRGIDKAEAVLAGTIPVGPRTIILDEPDSGFSLPWQYNFWTKVMRHKNARKLQVIVATHSPFALGIKGANYIETEPGYVQHCTQIFRSFKFGDRNE